jgi:hypothetical protein
MTAPQISGKYQCQVDLKELGLPVTFTIPDIPDTQPSAAEPTDPSHHPAIDKESSFVDISDSTTQFSQSVTHTLGMGPGSPDNGDQLSLLSVCAFPFCELPIYLTT